MQMHAKCYGLSFWFWFWFLFLVFPALHWLVLHRWTLNLFGTRAFLSSALLQLSCCLCVLCLGPFLVWTWTQLQTCRSTASSTPALKLDICWYWNQSFFLFYFFFPWTLHCNFALHLNVMLSWLCTQNGGYKGKLTAPSPVSSVYRNDLHHQKKKKHITQVVCGCWVNLPTPLFL